MSHIPRPFVVAFSAMENMFTEIKAAEQEIPQGAKDFYNDGGCRVIALTAPAGASVTETLGKLSTYILKDDVGEPLQEKGEHITLAKKQLAEVDINGLHTVYFKGERDVLVALAHENIIDPQRLPKLLQKLSSAGVKPKKPDTPHYQSSYSRGAF